VRGDKREEGGKREFRDEEMVHKSHVEKRK
jgi:hypothetical protein